MRHDWDMSEGSQIRWSDGAASAEVQEVGFLLLPGFALMSFAAASEPLRAANLIAGRPLYRVHAFTAPEATGPGTASSGAVIPAAPLPRPEGGPALHTLFVCAGGQPADWAVPGLPAALRAMAQAGVRLGGISGGAWCLAAAGLLERARFTIHWEHAEALIEAFPHLRPERTRFVLDGARLTCGGGVAPLDMMHALIAERLGGAFARRVSDWFLHVAVAGEADPQRGSLAERWGSHHPGLLAVLEKMEATIEAPLPRAALARLAGVSPRHLDRLFAVELGVGLGDSYRRIRLEHARRLLQQSPLTLSEIAFATGFSSASHFGRAYAARFGETPGGTRARLRG